MQGDSIWMTSKDRKRLYIVRQALERKVTQKEACKLLEISLRQVKRICQRMKKEGDGGVIHKNRMRASNHRIESGIKKKVMNLAKKRYRDFDQLEGEPGMSQFERAMKELGIQVIHANSPQAKGRIERFFRTLQDRLVKEMRVLE